jgi:hypothetical protein
MPPAAGPCHQLPPAHGRSCRHQRRWSGQRLWWLGTWSRKLSQQAHHCRMPCSFTVQQPAAAVPIPEAGQPSGLQTWLRRWLCMHPLDDHSGHGSGGGFVCICSACRALLVSGRPHLVGCLHSSPGAQKPSKPSAQAAIMTTTPQHPRRSWGRCQGSHMCT